jgi:hypothetical protein
MRPGNGPSSPAAIPDRPAPVTSLRTAVTDVEALSGRWIRLTFADGAVHDVDLAPVLSQGGVFSAIRDDREAFEAVSIDPETRTVAWPGDVDLDPDVLRGDFAPASGHTLPRRVVQTA